MWLNQVSEKVGQDQIREIRKQFYTFTHFIFNTQEQNR